MSNDTYPELQTRLAVGIERNRANGDKRHAFLTKIKKEHNCDSLGELREKLVIKEAEAVTAGEKRTEAQVAAVEAVETLENALNGEV